MFPDIVGPAAVLVAVASVLNLGLSAFFASRRERLKWAREALSEATFTFVDASFQAKDAATRLRQLYVRNGSSTDIQGADSEMWREREKLRNALTRLRVLSPAQTIQAAQAVRQATSNYCNALGSELRLEQENELIAEIRRAREQFVADARRQMGLRG
ncbi:MAG: hypothetical protein ACRDRH_27085 [Pseudonocardia sp.]